MLAVIGLELCWLVVRGKWPLAKALLCLVPGALMLLALRAALTGLDWRMVALPLMLSFPIHLADLAQRARHIK